VKTLEGVRVLDLTQAYSGPFCTMNLADHGAEVIKIERPGIGDQARTWNPFRNGYSAYYAFLNRNKKGITLDLKSPKGKEVFLKLVIGADVVCENFSVGTMEKLGLGYDVLKKVNPKIIYASISGFGLTGPLAEKKSYDIVAQAMSGMMSITGSPEGPPTKVGPSIGDNCTGIYLALGVVMALFNRERTGEGERLDVAMMDTLLSLLENAVVEYTVAGIIPPRRGNRDPGLAPYDCYDAQDGSIVLAIGTDLMWAKLCDLMGRSELACDPRFDSNHNRNTNYIPYLRDIVQEYTQSKTQHELEEVLEEAGLPVGVILNVAEAVEHPQTKVREMVVEIDDPGLGRIRIPGIPIKMHLKPGAIDSPAPLLGEHNIDIYTKLGLSTEEIQGLVRKSVI
jgi:CoA:oxalate CoA-transferase